MVDSGSYGSYTYGFGAYGGEIYPTVDVELDVAAITVNLSDASIDLELTA